MMRWIALCKPRSYSLYNKQGYTVSLLHRYAMTWVTEILVVWAEKQENSQVDFSQEEVVGKQGDLI